MTPLLFQALIFISCIIGYGAVVTIDTAGLFWLFKKRSMDFVYSMTGITQPLIWLGWSGIVVGLLGTLSFTPLTPLITYQLILLGILGLNGIFLQITKKKLNLTNPNQKLPLFSMFLATFISQTSWITFLLLQFTSTP
ncbi:MAG: hypothetical protein NTV02_03600 [Candidatus Zambryskibacteria bacterium]|nr:hypothetical protein [Candidatus Zambryskibacteria bacterium]